MDSRKTIIRNGKPLKDWLLELIAEDSIQAYPAAKEIEKFATGIPDGYIDIMDQIQRSTRDTLEERQEVLDSFTPAVKSAIQAEGFDTKKYIHELFAAIFRTKIIHAKLIRENSRREDRAMNKLVQRMKKDHSDKNMDKQMSRLSKTICYDCNKKNPRVKYYDCLTQQIIGLKFVFGALDEELLLDKPSLRRMVAYKSSDYIAAEALYRIGPKAKAFIPALLKLMHEEKSSYGFKFAKSLASIIHQDKQQIHDITKMINSPEENLLCRAMNVVMFLGHDVSKVFPDAVTLVIEKALSPNERIATTAIETLGKIGRGYPNAIDCLLECTNSKSNWIKGEAITALGNIAERPDHVIPRLVELFDEYEEEDPDYTYESDYDRIATALQRFGVAAKSAIPAIVKHLRRKDPSDGYWDKVLIKALEAMGPEALPALGELERIAQECEYTEEDIKDAGKGDNILGYTIRQLRQYKENA